MNKTPAPLLDDCERAGVAANEAHAPEGTNDVGNNGSIRQRRESMGTAQGEGGCVADALPTCAQIVSELNRAKVAFQQRAIVSVVCAAPFITENGKVSPLVPVAIIDRESDAGSYADALAHSVHIKQEDFNG